MICIIGSSASGKSSLEKELVKAGYLNIISYTSRSIRLGETNHLDYHFITDDEFYNKLNQGFFAEHTLYNGWHYGIAVEDCNENAIAVIERVGLSQLKKKFGNNIFTVFVDTPQRVCLKRMIDRGDNLLECFRRIFSDEGNFSGVKDECDIILNNDRPIQETVDELLKILKERKLI